jgi:hypothetical protein
MVDPRPVHGFDVPRQGCGKLHSDSEECVIFAWVVAEGMACTVSSAGFGTEKWA